MSNAEYDALEKLCETLGLGMQLRIERPRHQIVIMKTQSIGIHSGRWRFLVACTTCEKLLHEATTGPVVRIRDHEREVA